MRWGALGIIAASAAACAASSARSLPAGEGQAVDDAFADAVRLPGPSSTLHYLEAKAKEYAEDYAGAADALRLALAFDPESARLHAELGRILFFTGAAPEAERELRAARRLAPGWVEPHFWLGELAFSQNRLDEAERSLRQAVDLDATHAGAVKRLAEVAYLREGIAAATNVLEEAVRRDSYNAQSWATLASLHQLQQNYDRLEECLKQLLELDPDNAAALERLSEWYAKTRRFDEAIRLFSELAEILPPNPLLSLHMGEFYLQTKKLGEARRLFDQAKSFDPSDTGLAMSVGLTYLDAERYDEAAAEFAAIRDAGDPMGGYLLGRTYKEKGDCKKALRVFRKADNPTAEYRFNIATDEALCLWRLKRRDDADRKMETMLKEAAQEVDAFRLAAHYFRETKRLPRAIEAMKAGLLHLPDHPDLLYFKGLLLEEAGRPDEALAAMQHLLLVQPDHADALNFVGYSLAERGVRYNEAEAMIRKALRLKPDEGYIIDSLGWLYYRKGEYVKASTWLALAVMIEPDEPEVLLHLALALKAQGGREVQLAEALDRAALLVTPTDKEYAEFSKAFPERFPLASESRTDKP